MVAVTAVPGTDGLLRRAARMASRLKAELDVLHVADSDATRPGDRKSIEKLGELAADVGARWHEVQGDDPARAIAKFAQEHQITQIVIGSSQRSRWQQLTGGGSNVTRVIREAGPLGRQSTSWPSARPQPPSPPKRPPSVVPAWSRQGHPRQTAPIRLREGNSCALPAPPVGTLGQWTGEALPTDAGSAGSVMRGAGQLHCVGGAPRPALPGGCRVLSDQDRVYPLKALASAKCQLRAVVPRRRNRCLIGAPLRQQGQRVPVAAVQRQ